jgi:hypothetical protein
MPRNELETFYKATYNARRYVMRLPPPCNAGLAQSAPGTFARQNGFATELVTLPVGHVTKSPEVPSKSWRQQSAANPLRVLARSV